MESGTQAGSLGLLPRRFLLTRSDRGEPTRGRLEEA
jgi:hypothetical protein